MAQINQCMTGISKKLSKWSIKAYFKYVLVLITLRISVQFLIFCLIFSEVLNGAWLVGEEGDKRLGNIICPAELGFLSKHPYLLGYLGVISNVSRAAFSVTTPAAMFRLTRRKYCWPEGLATKPGAQYTHWLTHGQILNSQGRFYFQLFLLTLQASASPSLD